jgi:hypothetical protein
MELTLEQKMNREIEEIIQYLESTKKIREFDDKLDAVHRANVKVNGFTFRWQEKLEKSLLR